jgi:hypothetical protein
MSQEVKGGKGMRYILFVLALLGGISFSAVAYAEPGNDAHGKHRGDCMSNPDSQAFSDLCDDPTQGG